MANGGYTKEDLAAWARGQGGGDAGDGGAGADGAAASGGDAGGGAGGEPDGDEDQGTTSSDPCELLRQLGSGMEDTLKAMKGVTLPDDEDKAFAKEWESILEDAEEFAKRAKDAADEHEDLHEDDEDEEDDEEGDDEEEDDDDEKDE